MTLKLEEEIFDGIQILAIYASIALYAILRKNAATPKILHQTLLSLIFFLALVRFFYLTNLFGQDILQMDFSCYYTAAESMKLGLSPYKNYIDRIPPLWDGIALYQHARYSYPPLVVYLFMPLTFFSYAVAKYLWMALIVLCTAAVMRISMDIFSVKKTRETILPLAICVLLFYPMQAELERGQVNTVTLLLNVLAIQAILQGGRRDGMAGILWALSTFLKLYSVYVIPFLILRKKWNVLGGYTAGLAGLILISSLMHGSLLNDYWVNQLPRASWVGDWGTPEMKIPDRVIVSQLQQTHTPDGLTVKDGVHYKLEYEKFLTHATLVEVWGKSASARKFYKFLVKIDLARQGRTLLGWLFLLFFLGTLWVWQTRCRFSDRPKPQEEFIYWQAILIVIMLVGARTESMNIVWLLPVFVMIWSRMRSFSSLLRREKIGLGFCTAGMMLAGLPDYFFEPLTKDESSWLTHKYIYAQILVLAGLLGALSVNKEPKGAQGGAL